MRQIIRSGVFETNSSSTHSLSYTKDVTKIFEMYLRDTCLHNKTALEQSFALHGKLYITPLDDFENDESAMEVICLQSPLAKACYAYTRLAAFIYEQNVTRVVDETYKILPSGERRSWSIHSTSFRDVNAFINSPEGTEYKRALKEVLKPVLEYYDLNSDEWELYSDSSEATIDSFYLDIDKTQKDGLPNEPFTSLEGFKEWAKEFIDTDTSIILDTVPYHNYSQTITFKVL